ncbi:hypothetical protein Anas_01700 [Armadillidium nasatum]|uniref:Uncharacterized protein n=1 Tax=Armadillidium nasatum TaxID=96803 RepID=A0A5N5SXS1_9CRUS|nr:hypothetical protein Anas_01700 [Armadillidium nasatum]
MKIENSFMYKNWKSVLKRQPIHFTPKVVNSVDDRSIYNLDSAFNILNLRNATSLITLEYNISKNKLVALNHSAGGKCTIFINIQLAT